ncbi:Subtilase family protein [Duganella sacchari]|uniref:Subtilase family protein n=1 Tax=Duganella sacchari TaxID=551987 RepID=A0A1M7NK93_9BURK|nr:S8 family serine peptidase [Duganella sacchari]SHN03869.1 Subtilase family protein [Duganella sacchari]
MPKNLPGGATAPPDAPVSSADGEAAASPDGSSREARGIDGAAAPKDTPQPNGRSNSNGAGRSVGTRKKQFVIASRLPPDGLQTLGFQPLQFDAVEQALRSNSDIEVVDKISLKSTLGALADGMGGAQGVLVARMTEQKAAALHQQAQGRLLVERDQQLNLMDPALRLPGMVTGVNPSTAGGPVLNAVISVIGKDGAPQANAEVSLFGSMLPASGVTDANGQVSLSLFGETADTVRGLYVKPKADYWSFYQRDPDISSDEPNVVALRALSDWPSLAGFPRQRAYGWGQKAMRLDQLPSKYRGQGIKIGIIDSGAATTHDNLHGIHAGFDIINKKVDPNTWDQDTLGHGTHCAGVIAAADIASGIRGFAPDAEIHACKLFPGGQISQLIEALEYCIDKQIDVVNLSLGGEEVSEALEQQIMRAKRAGVACIVAAGNSAGPVQYPASSPNVLAVAAIGKFDEFPADSYHAQTLDSNVDAYGYFSAKFSCFGPQVAVCAPGVAITSCVPPNNFAAWDGTSMATPHVTGLAALCLAHHPDFQSPQYKTPGPGRVERLFQIIRASAHRVSLGDQSRIGFGLPDVLAAVGLQLQAGQQVAQAMAPQQAGGMAYDPLGLDMMQMQMSAQNQPWPLLHVGRFPLPHPYNPIMW